MLDAAATAIVCALAALNRSAESMPPIQVIETAPRYNSVGTEAFVDRDSGSIVVIASSNVVRDAADTRGRCGDSSAVKKLASVLIHEEWHIRHGPDEAAAYRRQLIALITLGVAPDSNVYRNVQRSMIAVLDAQKRNRPVSVLANASMSGR
jgi:hypothetical protein